MARMEINATREFVSKARDPLVLITEGTRAGPYEEERTPERSVCDACRVSVESSSSLVIADFSPKELREAVALPGDSPDSVHEGLL
jgi:mRNA degradation ribonuclease J1/J2